MFKQFGIVVALGMLVGMIAVGATSVAAATCTPTGFMRDNINMTAAKVNPSGTVSGNVDASGCNIGVYYDHGNGKVDNANIHGANYFGIVVNGDANVVSVNITDNKIHTIGETPLNGTQHGVAIYYRAFLTGKASGKITGNTISVYQKGGIVAVGKGTDVEVRDNTVVGQGPVNYIAQNGIEVGYGADVSIRNNRVTGNSYTGAGNVSSGGILIVGGPLFDPCPGGQSCPYVTKTDISGNTLLGNDVGVFIFNADAAGNAPPTPTNISVRNNTIRNPTVNNTTGTSVTPPKTYQAGISDFGNNDRITGNEISGDGYDPATVPGGTFAIDTTGSIHPRLHHNDTDV